MELSSSLAPLRGLLRWNSSRKISTFHTVCTTTLTKQECWPVLFSNPGAAAASMLTDSSSVAPTDAACRFLRLPLPATPTLAPAALTPLIIPLLAPGTASSLPSGPATAATGAGAVNIGFISGVF
eukprot:scaffold5868_cov120-Isochrysis_galbana.AAC.10